MEARITDPASVHAFVHPHINFRRKLEINEGRSCKGVPFEACFLFPAEVRQLVNPLLSKEYRPHSTGNGNTLKGYNGNIMEGM